MSIGYYMQLAMTVPTCMWSGYCSVRCCSFLVFISSKMHQIQVLNYACNLCWLLLNISVFHMHSFFFIMSILYRRQTLMTRCLTFARICTHRHLDLDLMDWLFAESEKYVAVLLSLTSLMSLHSIVACCKRSMIFLYPGSWFLVYLLLQCAWYVWHLSLIHFIAASGTVCFCEHCAWLLEVTFCFLRSVGLYADFCVPMICILFVI